MYAFADTVGEVHVSNRGKAVTFITHGRGCYGKERVKVFSVIMDLEPSGTRREEMSQQSSINIQESKKSYVRPARMP